MIENALQPILDDRGPLGNCREFGIQSPIVANRTREIGVRMSFGASAAQIKRMVLKDGYRPSSKAWRWGSSSASPAA